ncbi:MAG: class I SAM-dependent methyltransferase [Candidatus Diapherotrites archaeon]
MTNKKSEEIKEMSKYIDISTYDEAEATHPFYGEMVSEMIGQIRKTSAGKRSKLLELGAGTGLFTRELLKLPNLIIDALEIDGECYSYLGHKFGEQKINLIQGDAVFHSKEGHYDIIASCFAHDHTSSFGTRLDFSKTLAKNLAPGGIYVVGQEIIPKFSNMEERRRALRTFQGYIVWQAIQDGHEEVAGLELASLKSAVDETGDWKRHMEMFEEEMRHAGLKEIFRKKMGPADRDDIGGVYVFVYRK